MSHAPSDTSTHVPHDPSRFRLTPPDNFPYKAIQSSNKARLQALLAQKILFLDGAMGTEIQNYKLTEADYRGERFATIDNDVKGNNDLLVLTQPDIIRAIHQSYLEAGADIIETNSFNGTQISMADYHMQHLSYEINKTAAQLARQACDDYTAKTPDKPRFVAGVIGPTSRTCSISPDVHSRTHENHSRATHRRA